MSKRKFDCSLYLVTDGGCGKNFCHIVEQVVGIPVQFRTCTGNKSLEKYYAGAWLQVE